VELALRLNGEIVGADSQQVYRHFDIGTAKPTACQMQTRWAQGRKHSAAWDSLLRSRARRRSDGSRWFQSRPPLRPIERSRFSIRGSRWSLGEAPTDTINPPSSSQRSIAPRATATVWMLFLKIARMRPP